MSEESKEIVQAKEEVALGSLMANSPDDVVKRATGVATALAKIIEKKYLFVQIKNKKFVRVEGWNTLGAMLGVIPREREVTQIEDGWQAYVELVRASDGLVIGGASAICTRQEKNWRERDEFAVRSMSITRATGKAFRLSFSWIMSLAGYEPTPAEEMDGIIEGEVLEEQPIKKHVKKFTDAQIAAVIKYEKEFENKDLERNHVVNLLSLSNKIDDKTSENDIIAWIKKYRYEKDTNKADTGLAADVADKEILGG